MDIKINQKIKKGATVIEGFPGFGLVGTIVTEYLIEHLNAKQIGYLWSNKVPSIVALHQGKVVEPLAIFYDDKHNIVLLRAIAPINGLEWELAECTEKFCKEMGAKEVVSIEGVGGQDKSRVGEPKTFYHSSNAKNQKKLGVIGINSLSEGIVVGVTASLLSKMKDATFLFVEAFPDLPDSRAAAKLIEVLDKYLGLKVDYKPLIKKAEEFESKIKSVLSKSFDVSQQKEQRDSSNYFG